MNPRMLPRMIALLGKMAVKYDALSHSTQYTNEELDLLRNAIAEYEFYHAHEKSDQSKNVVQEQAVASSGARKTLGLKTPR